MTKVACAGGVFSNWFLPDGGRAVESHTDGKSLKCGSGMTETLLGLLS
mgnify:CR=1|jgi:hypothetical protein|tara:strand:- start:1157 stop:1300 length:144 start_codon:yes stop_codon:yes gene_type:complete